KPDGTTNWSLNYAWLPFGGGPALDTNGILYVNNGNLLAIYATSSLAQTVWPKYQHDLKNTGKLAPTAPTNLVASDGLYPESILVGWTPVSSASGYDLYRGTNSVESAAQLCGSEIAATNFMDGNIVPGVTYYYWPKARDNSGASALFGPNDTGWGHTFVSSPAGDYDQDGKADPAAYNNTNGNWKVRLSSNDYVLATAESLLGGAGWTAVAADFDGDHLADPAVYQEATGDWIVRLSSANYAALTATNFLGSQGNSALAADVDGDGLADPTIYNEANGNWTAKLSSLGYVTNALAQTLGSPGWYAVLADFDGDAKADPAVYQESSGSWSVKLSSAGDYYLPGLLGGSGFRPIPADYDGDGLADPAVYNPTTGDWKVMLSDADYYQVDISGLLAP
ncbi:MAG: hypothetical protein HYV35_10585, partial [Lentisphaerae bacterium]|nr:hypothetical protein [Lentisphaerota bacterium]